MPEQHVIRILDGISRMDFLTTRYKGIFSIHQNSAIKPKILAFEENFNSLSRRTLQFQAVLNYQPSNTFSLPSFIILLQTVPHLFLSKNLSFVSLASEQHAKRCLWRHSDAPELKTRDYVYGENLYLTTARTLNEAHAVKSWYEEVDDYSYGVFGLNDSCTPGKMCGHFTSLAWAETYRVGCAATNCKLNANEVLPNKDVILLVCQYYPHGNTVGKIPWASVPGEQCKTVDSSSSLCEEKTSLCDEKRTCDKDGTKFCELSEDETAYSCRCKDHFLGKHCERKYFTGRRNLWLRNFKITFNK